MRKIGIMLIALMVPASCIICMDSESSRSRLSSYILHFGTYMVLPTLVSASKQQSQSQNIPGDEPNLLPFIIGFGTVFGCFLCGVASCCLCNRINKKNEEKNNLVTKSSADTDYNTNTTIPFDFTQSKHSKHKNTGNKYISNKV